MATCNVDVSLDDLKQETGITDQHLDSKISSLEDGFLLEIADLFGSYEHYVHALPGLSSGDKADIRDCAFKNGNKLAVFKAFTLWRGINPYVTVRSLVEVLLSLRKRNLVHQICLEVSSLTLEPHQTEKLVSTEDSSQLPEPRNDDFLETSPSAELGPTDLLPSIPTRDQTQPITCSVPQTGCLTTAEHINTFEKRFYDLRMAVLAELKHSGERVEKFRQSIMTLPSAIRNEHREFVMKNYSLFEKAETIESIFLHLNFYLSFIDFSLLEHIIECYGSEKLKHQMKCYARDMRQFRTETTISDVLPHLPRSSDSPEGYSRLELKLDMDITTATLEDIDQIRRQLASSFLLSQFALFLSEMKKSSLVVIWLIPTSLVPYLKERIRVGSLSNDLILELQLDGECIYQQKVSAQKIEQVEDTARSSKLGAGVIRGKTISGVEDVTGTYPGMKNPRTHTFEPELIARTYRIIGRVALGSSGLAIGIHSDTRPTPETDLEFMRSQFRDLGFGIIDADTIGSVNHRDLIYAVSQAVLPVSPDYPIVVTVTGHLMDANTMMIQETDINIAEDIIEPLLSAPLLADNPKIFLVLITSSTSHPSKRKLAFPSQGNFIVAFIETFDLGLPHYLLWRILHIHCDESIEEVLIELQKEDISPTRTSMTVISHLDRPVYLKPPHYRPLFRPSVLDESSTKAVKSSKTDTLEESKKHTTEDISVQHIQESDPLRKELK